MKLRHRIITAIGRHPVGWYCRLAYGVKIEPFRQQNGRQYLIVLNHQTVFDQFFVAAAFRGPVYYLATEDIFSNGWVSSLIKYLVEPIPIKKQVTDVGAVRNCLRVAKEGGTIALAPEGNRTYSGRTEYMNPAIAKLAKALKLPVAVFRIEGGYGVQPRWADKLRKGKMRAFVSEVIEPEEVAALSEEALFQRIRDGIFVDDTKLPGEYHHKNLAEYMERAVYICPDCGFSEFESAGDTVTCKKCGKTVRYLPDKTLKGEGGEFPFRYVADWYDYQKDFVNSTDLAPYRDTPLYKDTADLYEVILYKNKQLLEEQVEVSLYGDRVEIKGKENRTLPFDEVTVAAVLGRNKLNLYHGDRVYQFKGSKRFNALKYVHIYHRYKNISKGDPHGQFLGL